MCYQKALRCVASMHQSLARAQTVMFLSDKSRKVHWDAACSSVLQLDRDDKVRLAICKEHTSQALRILLCGRIYFS